MAGVGGRTRTSGQGRPKGTPNKATKALKDMILGALAGAGGEAYLTRQANENPAPFMALIGKVLPTTLAGDPQNPLIPPESDPRKLALVLHEIVARAVKGEEPKE